MKINHGQFNRMQAREGERLLGVGKSMNLQCIAIANESAQHRLVEAPTQ